MDASENERGLKTEGELRRLRLHAYYDVLVEDQGFRRALTALAATIAAVDRNNLYPPPAAYEDLGRFARAWCLPTDEGVLHLWECLRLAGDRREPWRWLTPDIDLGDGVEVGTIEIDERGQEAFRPRDGLDPETLEPGIVPPTLPIITYDPTSESASSIRARLSRVVAAAHKNMLEQVEGIEQETRASGRRALPPRLHATDRRRMARRLFLRTRGMRPTDIAVLEQDEMPGEVVDPENVRETVGALARLLRIELPSLPGGRPPNPRS